MGPFLFFPQESLWTKFLWRRKRRLFFWDALSKSEDTTSTPHPLSQASVGTYLGLLGFLHANAYVS